MQNNNFYHQKNWNLDDLFPSHDKKAFLDCQAEMMRISCDFEKYRSHLSPSMDVNLFLEIIHRLELITENANRLIGYVELFFSEDTQNPESLSLYIQIESFVTESSNKTLFFNIWWKTLSDCDAQKFLDNSGNYRYYLEELRNFKKHTLSEAEEKIISLKNMTGCNALVNLYDSITNRYVFPISAEEKPVSRDSLMVYARSQYSELRKETYESLYGVYGKDGNILSQIYQNIVRDWHYENIQMRNFSAPISARNLSNSIPDDVIDILLETCQENKAVFQDYFHLKGKLLALDEMHRYDIYAPIQENQREIPYSVGVEMVLDSFSRFSEEFSLMARSVLQKDHINSEIKTGKRSGAFCLTVSPKYVPWVLLNYQQRVSDVSTLAHELGHAVHSLCAAEQNIFTHQACLPLAETASTFAEMLLTDFLLEHETDAEIKRNIIMKQLDDHYATIQRQAYFALFEKKAHSLIIDGANVEELNQAYLSNLQDQFGNSIIVDDCFKWEWVSIPHLFSTPFYVYAYSFGQLLVLSLYNQYKKEGIGYYPKYREILSAGGSKSPEKILSDAGFDFHDKNFWQGGFEVIKKQIDLLKKPF